MKKVGTEVERFADVWLRGDRRRKRFFFSGVGGNRRQNAR